MVDLNRLLDLDHSIVDGHRGRWVGLDTSGHVVADAGEVHRRVNVASPFDADQLAEHGAGPAVDATVGVSDLDSAVGANRLHEVKVFGSLDLAEHDVAGYNLVGPSRLDGAQVARVDLARHRVASRAERHGLTFE